MIRPRRALTTLPLVAATYFMVAGGPYGLEPLVQRTGVLQATIVLLVTPIVWSLPTSLMIAELGATIPENGGYYVWCTRALGPFWGFQETWLSLAASVFDMATYPALFVMYLGCLWPSANDHHWLISSAVVAAGVGLNVGGVKVLGRSSVALTIALLAPFAAIIVLTLVRHGWSAPATTTGNGDFLGAIVIAMWNYMGWDNASTIAGEVVRPQRTYPVAMLLAIALVALTYVLPVVATAPLRIPDSQWGPNAWLDVARAVSGNPLAICVAIGGMVCGLGMFNALLLSYSRLPAALANDGYLPAVFARRARRTDSPWVSLIVLAVAWCATFGLSFTRLVILDVLLYGAALLLEFVALIVLRIRQPALERPFKVPGGVAGTVVVAVGPTLLLIVALLRNERESIAGINGLWFGVGVIVAGPLLYVLSRRFRTKVSATVPAG